MLFFWQRIPNVILTPLKVIPTKQINSIPSLTTLHQTVLVTCTSKGHLMEVISPDVTIWSWMVTSTKNLREFMQDSLGISNPSAALDEQWKMGEEKLFVFFPAKHHFRKSIRSAVLEIFSLKFMKSMLDKAFNGVFNISPLMETVWRKCHASTTTPVKTGWKQPSRRLTSFYDGFVILEISHWDVLQGEKGQGYCFKMFNGH